MNDEPLSSLTRLEKFKAFCAALLFTGLLVAVALYIAWVFVGNVLCFLTLGFGCTPAY